MKTKNVLLKRSSLWRGVLLCSPLLLTANLSKAQSFAYDSAVQNWAVPTGVIKLSITAAGGQGGGGGADDYGAVFTGVCRVVPGDTLSIVAAGKGGSSISNDGNGGGGGSFVYDSNTLNLYVVAAGGGGDSYGNNNAGGNGGTDLVNNFGNPGSGPDGNAADGTGGNGGDTTTGYAPGGSGAGWLSNGGGSGMLAGYIAYGGFDRANGFWGGAINSSGPDNDWGGYGGGGYNGGGGGNAASIGNGGDGAGSYLNGTLIGSANATNSGNGYVNISYISLTTSTKKACFNSSNGMAMVAATGGTGAYTYTWAPGGQSKDTAIGLSAGTYTLMVSDSVGDYDSIPVTVSQYPQLTAMVTAPSGVCIGNCANARISPSGGMPSYMYLWSTGSTMDSIFICPDSNTTYSCVVTDIVGCTHDTTFVVKANPLPTLTISATQDTVCYTMTKDSLKGSPSGGTFSGTGVTGNNFNPSIAGMGTYKIRYSYTDSLACSNSDSMMVIVSVCAGIDEVIAGSGGFTLYPNPNTGNFQLQSSVTQVNSRLEVYNMLGEMVISRSCNGTNTLVNMNGSASGLYLYRVITQTGTLAATGKFIISR